MVDSDSAGSESSVVTAGVAATSTEVVSAGFCSAAGVLVEVSGDDSAGLDLGVASAGFVSEVASEG